MLSFAVSSLIVKHVIVLGHYGCGGVAASMVRLDEHPSSPADIAVQKWIAPIREIYATSTRYVLFATHLKTGSLILCRKEIVLHRQKFKIEGSNVLPDLHDRMCSSVLIFFLHGPQEARFLMWLHFQPHFEHS